MRATLKSVNVVSGAYVGGVGEAEFNEFKGNRDLSFGMLRECDVKLSKSNVFCRN